MAQQEGENEGWSDSWRRWPKKSSKQGKEAELTGQEVGKGAEVAE